MPADWDNPVTIGEYWEQVTDYASMMVDMADEDIERVGDLIELLDDFPPSAFEQSLDYLSSDSVVNLPEEKRIHLWRSLTALVRRHRDFPDADWALSEEFVSRIQCVADKLLPQQLSNLHKLLFSSNDLQLYDIADDWEEVEQERTTRRRKAIEQILESDGLCAVVRFAEEVEEPDAVGYALADTSDQSMDETLIPAMLDADDNKQAQFLRSYVWRRRYAGGWEWVDGFDVSGWTDSQIGRFLACLPFVVNSWKRVESLLGDAEDEYWSIAVANPYDPECDIEFAVEKLLANGRPRAALKCLQKQVFDSQPINENHACTALLTWHVSSEQSPRIDPYVLVKIISALQDMPNSNLQCLMEVEWFNLGLFDDRRLGAPKTLESGLATDPDLFCEFINVLYPRQAEESSSGNDLTLIQGRSRNAWKLLRRWQIPPGTQPDGTFQPDAFRNWLQRVNKYFEGREIAALALQKLGEVLAHSPPDPSGLWIHREVAEVLNDKNATPILQGYYLGVVNSRGTRFINWTGTQESAFADDFMQKAEEVELEGYALFGAELRRIAEGYRLQAEQVRARVVELEEA